MKSKSQKSQPKVPRQIAEITTEFQTACAQAGHLQYQIEVHTKELARLNERLLELNLEASSRNNLDRQKGQTSVALPKQETTQEAVQNA